MIIFGSNLSRLSIQTDELAPSTCVTRSTACLLGCLKPEGEGLEELREWFGWKEIECSGETVFSLLCETSGNLVGKKS